ncbi:50S ribosomal protein L22 [Candidatus Trichorickettsia mobilis]|uniref:Large ribosomal subunit protein uL22 n=1 Tax=Candidatus Trichorickettsia mobilis TaxID=1346319 RepID=A0ABZ0USP1_9RICK|nr:50S ribosomal protein L22 [Candidatus Trichorickettsia mobilis]WPY00536.1 50S ribosomal protein L22 [Candidatus Trichorickettsia mobilis]
MAQVNKNSATAVVKLLRVGPRKLNLVAASIRNMKVSEALIQLSFSHKRIARAVKAGLQSAIANAENNFGLDIDDLFVTSATVGKGLVMKRMMVRARGRAGRIDKFFSNLYITVTEGGRK